VAEIDDLSQKIEVSMVFEAGILMMMFASFSIGCYEAGKAVKMSRH